MKISELKQQCGKCQLIELCGEPFSNICLCSNLSLSELTENEYLHEVITIRNFSKRNLSNKTLEKKIIKSIKSDFISK